MEAGAARRVSGRGSWGAGGGSSVATPPWLRPRERTLLTFLPLKSLAGGVGQCSVYASNSSLNPLPDRIWGWMRDPRTCGWVLSHPHFLTPKVR